MTTFGNSAHSHSLKDETTLHPRKEQYPKQSASAYLPQQPITKCNTFSRIGRFQLMNNLNFIWVRDLPHHAVCGGVRVQFDYIRQQIPLAMERVLKFGTRKMLS